MTTTTSRARTAPTAASSTDRGADIGLLVLRVVAGALIAGHGAQKLFGWFGGSGLSATADGFDRMGYNPGVFFGTLAGLSEFGGGLLLILGLLTPLGAAAVLGTMINVIAVHWDGGVFGNGGYELPLLYAAVAAGLAFTGPGRFALDHGRPWNRTGIAVGAAAVGIAVLAAVLTLLVKAAF
ncbi:DoxX family protein [Nocardia harenae]|uniref:DoxX family protein n=1 Tax=Nocardia harenae TaxID=358707 RepID=UPI000836B32D|nr:DoxX family protein [Nocardia harenae]